jgi:oligogalacturonide lyase
VERLAGGPGNTQHLYFTGASISADGRLLVVLDDADRPARGPYDPDALVNVEAVELATGERRRLSDNRVGVRRAYVYFGGHPDTGLAPGSVVFDPAAAIAYMLAGRTIWTADARTGVRRPLATIEPGLATGYAAVSGSGRRMCLPVIDTAAFRDLHAIDRSVRELGLCTRVQVWDTSSGGLVDEVEIRGAWVTHVQFRPGTEDVLLFNHEWAEAGGERRLWIRDAGGVRPLRTRAAVRSATPVRPDDVVDHEIWSPDGRTVIYHGTYADDAGALARRSFLGRAIVDEGVVDEVPFPPGFDRYGHFAVVGDSRVVTDGCATFGTEDVRRPVPSRLDAADAPGEDDGGSWISTVRVDWDAGHVEFVPLARHGSSWSSQDAHPHPVVDADRSRVVFTSDRDGRRAVYAVGLDAIPSEVGMRSYVS